MHRNGKYLDGENSQVAIVFGKDYINTLGVIRSLGRRNIPVICLDFKKRIFHFNSKYCSVVSSPDPAKEEQKFIDFMVQLGDSLNTKGIIIPTSEKSISTILRFKSDLEKYYEIPPNEFDAYQQLTSKDRFYRLLDDIGFPHPKTYFPLDIYDVIEISSLNMYPLIIKPIDSVRFAEQFHVKCFNCNSSKELLEAYNRAIVSGHDVVIQEVIPGGDNNLYGFCSYCSRDFALKGAFIYRKIRGYPKDFGTCSLIESVWEPDIYKLGKELLERIHYSGISELEVKRDPRDNTFKIIELNARTWWQNRLAARCGVDLPYMAYLDAINDNIEEVISKKEGVKWIYMFDDLRSCCQRLLRGQLSLTEYIASLKGEKEYAIYAKDDMVPFYDFLLSLLCAAPRYVQERINN